MTKNPTYLVVNKIDTLRHLTQEALKQIGVDTSKEARNIEEAEHIVKFTDSNMIIIYELSLARSLSEAVEFMHMLKNYQSQKQIDLIVTSLVITEGLKNRIHAIGVKEFVAKTYNIEEFSSNLQVSIHALLNQS